MLFQKARKGYIPWSIGAAEYQSQTTTGEPLTMGIRCRLGNADFEDIALLDTGARYSVINSDIAETISDSLGEPLNEVTISTRYGPQTGSIHRLMVSLLADEGLGNDVEIEASVAVLPRWPGPVVIGVTGLLERVRFAVDPGVRADSPNLIFFGLPADE